MTKEPYLQGPREYTKSAAGAGPARDVEDLGAVYDAHAAYVYAYVRSLGAAASLAEDVLQEAFLKLLRRRRGVSDIENMRAFLTTVARREFYSWGTKMFRRREISAGDLSGAFEPASQAASAESAALIEDALAHLPLPLREVVVMKIFGGLTFEKIAEAMQINPNPAASRYRYAMAKLRELLGEG